MYKNQTNKMLAQEGVLQKGGTVDPVSGNDVPPGAMPEEVRDDVDAKLSEGEFVVPADVVRYIGLAKLMEMRDEAKRGLQKMTDIGQMGNSKKGAEGEALHGEEGEEEFASTIDEIMNEEEGGEEETPKYAAGGYVPRASGYDPAESVALYSRAPIKGFEMIPMSNDTGNTIYIPFINGKPQLQVPPGYAIKAKTVTEAAAPPVAPTAGGTGTAETGGGVGGSGGQDVGTAVGSPSGPDSLGLGPAADRSNISGSLRSLADIASNLPGIPGLVAKGYLAATKSSSAADLASLKAADETMSVSRSAFTALERSAAISKAIDNSITNNTDPTAELEAIVADMFAAPAPVAVAAPVAQSILGAGTALSPLASEAEAKAAAAQEAREAANREAAAQSAREAAAQAAREAAAQSAREAAAQSAREAANREAAAQSAREAAAQEAREAANREAAAQAAREAAAQAARETTAVGSGAADGGYGGFGGTTGGGDTMGFGGEYAKGGVVTKIKNKEGFVTSRSYPVKKKSKGFVPKK